jgi:hypothetical protein
VEKLPFLPYTTKKSMKVITRKIIPVNIMVVPRKPIEMVILIAVK